MLFCSDRLDRPSLTAMHKKSHKKKQKQRGKSDGREEVDPAKGSGDSAHGPCYEIRHSDAMGRHLVASRAIAAGEVIVEAPALVVGPCSGCALVCLGCYRELDPPAMAKCSGCAWPLCSAECAGLGASTGHSARECRALRDVAPDYTHLDRLKDDYHALMPLRCLLLKEAEPEQWRLLMAMEAHNDKRRARGDIWSANERLVLRRLATWGLAFDPIDVHTVCGVLEVNAFEVGGSGASARALYSGPHLLAHDCTPSTTHTDAERAPGRPLTVRAAVAHARGDLITLCYAYTLQGTLRRREHLRLSKFFECACCRCADPTELGTFASALRCERCGGRMLSAAPLDPTARWECLDACGFALSAPAVDALLRRLTDELEQIDANDVEGFERFLRRRDALYETHYLRLCALHSLSQLYGKVQGYMIHEMPERLLRRKEDVCRRLLGAVDLLEPGLSRLRGITLYELHAPLMVLTTRDFERRAIGRDELRTRLKEVVSCLRSAALILGFEPSHSGEGLMADAAREALRKITTWEQIIGKIS